MIKEIIVHCSASPDHLDIGLNQINAWHKQRGFSPSLKGNHCGYHYVIRKNGDIEQAREEFEIGVHCTGHNAQSMGICWVGDKDLNDKQRVSLFFLLTMALINYDLKATDVYGHCQFNPKKTCPNLDMVEIRKQLTSMGA